MMAESCFPCASITRRPRAGATLREIGRNDLVEAAGIERGIRQLVQFASFPTKGDRAPSSASSHRAGSIIRPFLRLANLAVRMLYTAFGSASLL
jgi:hypothetical protein